MAAVELLRVRDRRASDDAWVNQAIAEEWGRSFVVSRGRGHYVDALPGLIAERGSRPVGLLTYEVRNAALEVVTLQAMERRSGIGSSLMAAAREIAIHADCTRLWLITTNDNRVAIAFYAACGMRLVALHEGAIAESRKLKPDLPTCNAEGVPIRDELEFELRP